MPRINRIRIVNVPYDDGTKLYTDRIFVLQGKHSLINLANGGGKTLFLQMVLQSVLPNTSLAGRGFNELFKTSDHTSHILVEWLLDSETPEYLLTGICATKGDDEESDSIKFFMYTNNYKESNPFDILNIPVKTENGVTGYRRLQDIMRKAGNSPDYRVNYFTGSDRKNYREFLETFNLYSREWKGIRVTNNEEGGISSYFKNCQTAERVMRNLVIPSISEVLYETPEEERQMAKAFVNLREKLLKIPELESNIKVFESFKQKANTILDILESYKNQLNLKKILACKLWLVKEFIDEEINKTAAEKKKLEKEESEVEFQIKDTHFNLDSLAVFELYRRKKLKEKEIYDINCGIGRLKAERENIHYRIREAKAINKMIEIRSEKGEIVLLNERITSSQKGNEDLLKDLNLYSYNYKLKLKEKVEEVQKQLFTLENRKREIEQGIVELEERESRLSSKKEEIIGEITRIDEWFKNYDKIQREISSENFQWAIFPDRGVIELKKKIEENQNRINENKRVISERQKEIEDADMEIKKAAEQEQSFSIELSKKQTLLEDYREDLDEVRALLTRTGLGAKINIYSEKTMAEIMGKKVEFEEKLSREILNKSGLEEKEMLLAEVDFYLPNKDILKLKEVFSEYNISCVEGSSWLKEQPMTQPQKESLIKGNPLIPYSLIITQQDLKQLEKHKSKLTELQLDYPVPIMVRREENFDWDLNVDGLVPLFDREIYILYHKGFELFVSKEALENFKNDIEFKLQKCNEQIGGLKKSIEFFNNVIFKINEFTQNYNMGFEDEITAEIEGLSKRIHEIQKQIEKSRMKKTNANKEIDEKRMAIESLQNKMLDLQKQLEKLEGYQLLFNQEQENKQKKELLETRKRQNEEETKNIKKQKDKENETKMDLVLQIDRMESVLGEYRREYERIKDRDLKEDRIIEIDFDTLKSKVKGLEESLSKKTNDIEGFIKAVEEKKSKVRENERYISEELNINIEELPDTNHTISRAEIRSLNDVLNTKEREIEREEKKFREAENKLNLINYKIEELTTNRILKEYEKPPRLDFTGNLKMVRERLEFEIDTLRKKEQEIKNKLEELNKTMSKLKTYDRNLEFFINANNIIKERVSIDLEEEQLKNIKHLEVNMEKLSRKYTDIINKINDKKEEIRNQHEHFKNELGRLRNRIMNRFIDTMEQSLEENKTVLFDYDLVFERFNNCFKIVENYRKATEEELERYKKDKGHLVKQAVQQAERFHTQISSIDSFSKVNLDSRNIKMVRFELVEIEKDSMYERMSSYIDKIISDLKDMDTIEAEKEIEVKMSSANLLNVISDLERCRIRIFKPKEAGIKTSYVDWENVVAWSGGEKYTALFSMFITIIAFIRSKMSTKFETSKVILADNPFGKASASHLLDIIFNLANRNNTQMLCTTALKEHEILSKFDVVYSLVLRPVRGIGVVTSDSKAELDSGFHNIDMEQLNDEFQLSIFD